MNSTHTLSSGETLEVEVLGPGKARGDTRANRELWWFVSRPFEPWISPVETHFLARLLHGEADQTLRDYLYVGRIGGELAATAWHATSATSAEIGGYGFVFTHPRQRGKGMAQILTRLSTGQFWDDGGRASYLGTTDPAARHVYTKSGYVPYNGLVMRALRPGLDHQVFDRDYFAHEGPAQVRDARLGDLAAYTTLLVAHEPDGWVIRDFTESMFHAPPTIGPSGCLRPFFNALLRSEANPASQFKVLVTQRQRVVAAASLAASADGALRGTATLELLCHPSYRCELNGLLEDVLRGSALAGVHRVRAWAVGPDRCQALYEAGFADESLLPGLLDLGGRRADVRVLRRDSD